MQALQPAETVSEDSPSFATSTEARTASPTGIVPKPTVGGSTMIWGAPPGWVTHVSGLGNDSSPTESTAVTW